MPFCFIMEIIVYLHKFVNRWFTKNIYLGKPLDSKSSDRKIVWVRSPPPATWPAFFFLKAKSIESNAAQIDHHFYQGSADPCATAPDRPSHLQKWCRFPRSG